MIYPRPTVPGPHPHVSAGPPSCDWDLTLFAQVFRAHNICYQGVRALSQESVLTSQTTQ